MGADRWAKRASGLLVPNMNFGQRRPCPGCCKEEVVCGCTCSLCSDTAPCCFKIVIAGVVSPDPEVCEDCGSLNGTYYLQPDPDTACVWKCENIYGVNCANSNDITLTVYQDGADYKIKVELGSHTWIKNYGTSATDCCAIISDELTHSSSGSDCDSSAATCFITARTGSTALPCLCLKDCGKTDGGAPACLKLEWSGISQPSPFDWGDCPFCDCYDWQRIPWLPGESDCVWRRDHSPDSHLCDTRIQVRLANSGPGFLLTVHHYTGTAPYVSHLSFSKYYDDPPDMSAWNQEEIPLNSSGIACDVAGDAKVLITPDYSGCADRNWMCPFCACEHVNATRPDVAVTIARITMSAFGCVEDANCTDFNGTYVLEPIDDSQGRPCAWRYDFPETICGYAAAIEFRLTDMRWASIWIFLGEVNWLWRVMTEPTETRDCANFSYTYTGAWDTGDWGICDYDRASGDGPEFSVTTI